MEGYIHVCTYMCVCICKTTNNSRLAKGREPWNHAELDSTNESFQVGSMVLLIARIVEKQRKS